MEDTVSNCKLEVKDNRLTVKLPFFEEGGCIVVNMPSGKWGVEETPQYGGKPYIAGEFDLLEDAIKEALTYT